MDKRLGNQSPSVTCLHWPRIKSWRTKDQKIDLLIALFFFSQLVVFFSSSHSLICVFLFSIHLSDFLFFTFFSSSTLSLFHHYTFFTTFGEKLLCIVLYWEINNTHSKYWVNPILKNIVNPIQYPIRIARPWSWLRCQIIFCPRM